MSAELTMGTDLGVPDRHHVSGDQQPAPVVYFYHLRPPASIHTFPDEMLCEIFKQLHLLPGEELDPREPLLAQTAALFNVASVCRSWRAAALGCPALWSRRIRFRFDKIAHRGPEAARLNEPWLLFLQLQIKRAASRPLCISASLLTFDSAWEGSHGQTAFRLILDVLPRCWRFNLGVSMAGDPEAVKRVPLLFQVATPFLEEFTLIALASSEVPIRYPLQGSATFLPHAPRLLRLILDYPLPRYLTWNPFPALEDLSYRGHLTDPAGTDVFRILQVCKNISILGIEPTDGRLIDSDKYLQALSASTFTLPRLQSLDDRSENAVTMGKFVPLIARRCTNLQTFYLIGYGGIPAQLSSMAALGNITTLHISFMKDPWDRIRGLLPPLLRILPMLEEITCYYARFCAEDFVPLCVPDSTTGLWIAPRLQRVRCKIVHPYSLDWVRTIWQLVQFVKVRSQFAVEQGSSLRPLRVFDIDDSQFTVREMPEWVLAVIERLFLRVPRGDV